MPTRQLPRNPDLDHLRKQAKDLLKAHHARDAEAMQRIREFHPRFEKASDAKIGYTMFDLDDALLATAREYGFASWSRLKAHIGRPTDLSRPHHERIIDAEFRRAVDLLDAGDATELGSHLAQHPDLVQRHVEFEGGNYFSNPTLIDFIAENPIRRGKLPANIVEVARVILDAGARAESALGLVSSGRVPRECGMQIALIDLLCDRGADPNHAMLAALGHGEFEAAEALLRNGARLDLAVAAAMNRVEDARRLLPSADADDRHRALALAAQHGRVNIVEMLLDAGEDPNRYNPVGLHSHSTPIHQAALAGHDAVVRLLVERGARLDIRDILHHGTPLDWAIYAKNQALADYLNACVR